MNLTLYLRAIYNTTCKSHLTVLISVSFSFFFHPKNLCHLHFWFQAFFPNHGLNIYQSSSFLTLLPMRSKRFMKTTLFVLSLCCWFPLPSLLSCRRTVPSCRLRHAGRLASLATCCAAPVTCLESSASPNSSLTANSVASRRPRWKHAR